MDLLPSQMDLPGEVAEIQALTAEPESPAFNGCTGAQRAKIVRLREQIVQLTAAGVGVKRCASALGISPQSVRAVRASAWEKGELDPMKQRLGRQYLATADLLRAEAIERIDEIPAQVLLLASAQAADKGQLLTGGVTARIERVQVPADLGALIDALPVGPEASAGYKEGEFVPASTIEAASGDSVPPLVDTQSTRLPSEEGARVSVSVSPASGSLTPPPLP